jgi:hypothetical protein
MNLSELPGAIPFNQLRPDVQLVSLYVAYRNAQFDAGAPESELLTFAEWKESNG